MIRLLLSLAVAIGVLAQEEARPSANCVGVNAINPKCRSKETPYLRDFFYVGGRYVPMITGNVTVDQIYVEKLTPVSGVTRRSPLVFFHGGGTSAVTWLNTPDNRYENVPRRSPCTLCKKRKKKKEKN
jgi:hypothetical protein